MERNSKGIAVTVAIVAAVGISLLAMLAVLNRKDQTVGLNQEIQYDDFAFSVQSVNKAKSLGSGESQTDARGVYYIVALKIANHAKRVYYTFKKASAILVDDQRREFHLSDTGQQALASTQRNQCNDPIPAGASCTIEVAFDLPSDALPSQIRFSEAGSIGDILDDVFYGRKRIEIVAPQQ